MREPAVSAIKLEPCHRRWGMPWAASPLVGLYRRRHFAIATWRTRRGSQPPAWLRISIFSSAPTAAPPTASEPPSSSGSSLNYFVGVGGSRWLSVPSHILLDWLGSDAAAPIGIMALWPFTGEYYESSLHVFYAVSRRYWLPNFWSLNVWAVVRELMVLTPVTLAIGFLRARRSQSL